MQYYNLPTHQEEIAIAESFPVTCHLQSDFSRRSSDDNNSRDKWNARLDLFISLASCCRSTGTGVNHGNVSYEPNIPRF